MGQGEWGGREGRVGKLGNVESTSYVTDWIVGDVMLTEGGPR